MTYTLWSHGRLLGESPLDFIRCMPKLRVGFLYPSALGERLLPVAGGASPASIKFCRASRNVDTRDWHRLGEHAAYLDAVREADALKLELRGPDGRVIPTEDVCVRDYETLLNLTGEAMEDTFEDELEYEELREEFGEETLHSLCFDDLDATWDPESDEDDPFEFDDEDTNAPWRQRPEEPEERRWSRYQLQITLIHDRSIP